MIQILSAVDSCHICAACLVCIIKHQKRQTSSSICVLPPYLFNPSLAPWRCLQEMIRFRVSIHAFWQTIIFSGFPWYFLVRVCYEAHSLSWYSALSLLAVAADGCDRVKAIKTETRYSVLRAGIWDCNNWSYILATWKGYIYMCVYLYITFYFSFTFGDYLWPNTKNIRK